MGDVEDSDYAKGDVFKVQSRGSQAFMKSAEIVELPCHLGRQHWYFFAQNMFVRSGKVFFLQDYCFLFVFLNLSQGIVARRVRVMFEPLQRGSFPSINVSHGCFLLIETVSHCRKWSTASFISSPNLIRQQRESLALPLKVSWISSQDRFTQNMKCLGGWKFQ